jgi:hypothetical protein
MPEKEGLADGDLVDQPQNGLCRNRPFEQRLGRKLAIDPGDGGLE